MAETKTKHRKKCNTLARKFCTDLDERLLPEEFHGGSSQGRGLAQVNLVNMKSEHWEPRTAGVAYIKERGDRGMSIRFCPFCGTNLEPMLRDEKPAPREG